MALEAAGSLTKTSRWVAAWIYQDQVLHPSKKTFFWAQTAQQILRGRCHHSQKCIRTSCKSRFRVWNKRSRIARIRKDASSSNSVSCNLVKLALRFRWAIFSASAISNQSEAALLRLSYKMPRTLKNSYMAKWPSGRTNSHRSTVVWCLTTSDYYSKFNDLNFFPSCLAFRFTKIKSQFRIKLSNA